MKHAIKQWGGVLGLGLPPSTGMREALQWMMLARLCLLYLVLLIVVLHQVFQRGSVTGPWVMWGYGLLAGSFAFNLVGALLIERLPQRWGSAVTHIIFDAIVTSLWIHWTDARENLFALLYLIQILVVSLILYQKGALLAAAAACVGYGIVSAVHAEPAAALNWTVYTILFFTLGIVGGYLSEELLRTNLSLKEKSRNIEKLRALHERILADLPTGLLTVDSQGSVHFMNPAAEHILGISAAKAVGNPLSQVEPGLLPFFSKIEAQQVEGNDAGQEETVAAAGDLAHRTYFVQTKSAAGAARLQQTVEIGEGHRARILRGDVAELEAEATLSGLLDEAATGGRVLLFQDVTRLSHLQEKLKQHEKLAAVGQLAAGIAHEIRNPLASMSASIEMLKGSLPQNHQEAENQKLMDIAIREIDRLNRLVSEFLDFVKPEKFKTVSVDLADLVRDLLTSARHAKGVTGKIELVDKCSPVSALGNAEKLKQVVWNLVMNAIQAMTKPGKIEVGCSKLAPAKVVLWVEDQGEGMDEEVLAHLYEPFFTTKDKGTGLGLATAYKIVEAHRGEIRVTSRVGVGTRFEIHLPEATT